MKDLQNILEEIFSQEKLIRIIFSAKRKKSLPYRKVTIRPVNLSAEEASAKSMQLIQQDIKQINIFTEGQDIQILASNPK